MAIEFANCCCLVPSSTTLAIVSKSNSNVSVSPFGMGSNTKDEDLPCIDLPILLKLVVAFGTLNIVGVGL